ncbi:MAG: cytochrome c biogenesis protein ResB [Verrucomicrobiota bacterium]|nr:cytochrome c biogenesis protein ResB [Limisphaera sp.]MDW8380715.1 cytochrome c biogenesis protein ResB [Verrucomicrobiota bacterium]
MPLEKLYQFFSSLRLTVLLLVLGMVLVFLGTLAQVSLGLYRAQNEFFRSFFVYWGPPGASWRIPVFPGGYLLGALMLINLIAAHWRYFRADWRKSGIVLIHAGLVLLLLGQLATDLLSVESTLHLREGEAKNYSEVDRRVELAITEVTDPAYDQVVTIPQRVLERQGEVSVSQLPFTIRIRKFYPNAMVSARPADATEPAPADQGVGPQVVLTPLPHVTEMGKRDVPAAVVELVTPSGSLGRWLASEYISQPQRIATGGRVFTLAMRPQRLYKPWTIRLLDFRHDRYPGTDIPKNFSSRILLTDPRNGTEREVVIRMNSPLRYGGETYYQASYDPDDQGSVLQVVRNPSWLTPYIACSMITVGLLLQFTIHLFRFAGRIVRT